MSLVKELGFGSECVKLFWGPENRFGRREITAGRYEFIKGTGALQKIKQSIGKNHPTYVSIEEAASLGVQIDFEYQHEEYEKEIQRMKEENERIMAFRDKSGSRNKGVTINKSYTTSAPTSNEEIIQSLEDKKKLEAENEKLRKELAEARAAKEEVKSVEPTTPRRKSSAAKSK